MIKHADIAICMNGPPRTSSHRAPADIHSRTRAEIHTSDCEMASASTEIDLKPLVRRCACYLCTASSTARRSSIQVYLHVRIQVCPHVRSCACMCTCPGLSSDGLACGWRWPTTSSHRRMRRRTRPQAAAAGLGPKRLRMHGHAASLSRELLACWRDTNAGVFRPQSLMQRVSFNI